MLKIFYINLAKDVQRKKDIETQLENIGIPFERIEAINGNPGGIESKLRPAEIGCFLSHIKAIQTILAQNLDRAIVIEDDVTFTEWFSHLDKILKKLPIDFDVCWLGNSRRKFPRNPCDIIPDYDYNFLEKKRVSRYIYSIDSESVYTKNCPLGGYGILYSKKGCKAFLNRYARMIKEKPIDTTLVTSNLQRYMAIPSVIIHCFNYTSNITVKEYPRDYINPFKNVWMNRPEKEEELLDMLSFIHNLLIKNGIRYSLICGTLLGYGRNGRIIPWDDDVDIGVYNEDKPKLEEILPKIQKIYGVNTTHFKNMYKVYTKGEKIGDYDWSWPFVDIFFYRKIGINTFNIDKTIVSMSDELVNDKLYSNSSDRDIDVSVFKEYPKYLAKEFGKEWYAKCISSDWSHENEIPVKIVKSFNCKNVIPDYSFKKFKDIEEYSSLKKNEYFYDKKDKYSKAVKNIFFVLISIFIVYILLILLFIFFKRKK